ncbi:hypothetical protein GCM10010358_68170 [Streptomyces minutiscleroticus]|uniref:Uncharacterized protein n=1 Tax=Streptomyces minutiscleroticus TaxID=68238 RepID=A0A918NXK9_9ACTN|nr:hypothetical protein [Streptomyces minutiscleroticus]GGY05146.1 hypothetical protein GCM10010358_68170 [Streptomyces minutiscleroticus]
MFLVVLDLNQGLVAAPASGDDLTHDTQQVLTVEGFAWSSEIQAFVRQDDATPADVNNTADMLRELGHQVETAWATLPPAVAPLPPTVTP